MKVSLSWLKEYVSFGMDVYALADALTMAGLEVDSVSDRYGYLDHVITARISDIAPHPHAAKLQICDIDTGNETIKVVCGAPNVKKNMIVPCALPGAAMPDGSLIEKTIIREIESNGMLCSEAELALGPDASGIMALNNDLTLGTPLATALGFSDMVMEVDLTPNRSDCLSIIGIAREIAGFLKTNVIYPDVNTGILSAGSEKTILDITSVTIDAPDHCPRYAAKVLFDITVAPSPFWLKDRLLSLGLRPINNIVDITNFVMMETGQPLHAFDFDRLSGNRIMVRTAKEGETFTTLDQKERQLTPDMLMICDSEKPVALAGVMGGINSEITDSTTRVLIESACFDPISIRKTSKKLGLITDATHRFERGVDPLGTVRAMNRAAQLMVEIAGGKPVDGYIDVHPRPFVQRTIPLNISHANRLLGTSLNKESILKLLKSIEFSVQDNGEKTIDVIVPSFRVDILRPQDIMEEIARLSGYDTIPTTFPVIPAEAGKPSLLRQARNRIKNFMAGFGFSEIISYSFINKSSTDLLGIAPDDSRQNPVEILNPLIEDQAVMRTSLIPGLLETMRYNISQQEKNLKIFEIGKVFINKGKDCPPDEVEMAAGLWTGTRRDASWHAKEEGCDFYDIKGVVEALFNGLNLSHANFTAEPSNIATYVRPGHAAHILLENKPLGIVGELDPRTILNFNLKQTAFIFELNLDSLVPLISNKIQATPLPKFPATFRDVTLIIDKRMETIDILKEIENSGEKLIENLYIFDVYEGDPIPKDKKSFSFRITYRSPDETLKDDVINQLHKNITDMLINKFGASLS